MPKAALAIIFNHRYEQNLPKLRALYGDRFPDLVFVMPFARTTDADVIPVYESSAYFQSFLAHAWPTLERTDADFFVFTGDDCILNPALDAFSLATKLGLDEDCGYIAEMVSLSNAHYGWPHLDRVLAAAQVQDVYFNWRAEVPDLEEMNRRFTRHGLKTGTFRFEDRQPGPGRLGVYRDTKRYARFVQRGWIKPDFPIAYGYSDLVIVPRKHIAEFVNYCRVFAALDLFVEAAIPTALALAVPRIKTDRDSDWKTTVSWGTEAVEAMTAPMEKSMSKIAAAYGPKELAKHPIKLSAFENDLP